MSAPTRVSENWPYVREMADRMSAEKRLTEAELAAEYHAAWSNMLDVPKDERYPYEPGRIATLHRFASLPHYDQEQP